MRPAAIQWTLLLALLMSGVAVGGTIRVPSDQPTIQSGINAAAHGDTVLVDPGTYFENINFRGKNIVVTSRYFMSGDITIIHSTIINGSQPANADTGSCVLIISGEDTSAVLQGFTLTGGTGTAWLDEHGAGVYVEGGGILIALSSPTIRNNIIRNNNVNRPVGNSTGGGGIRLGDGSPRILNNFITLNTGMYGGGIVSNYATPIIRNNVIAKNYVYPAVSGRPTYGGGGVWINNQPARLDNNTIVENTSAGTGTAPAGRGGGIVAYFGGSATGRNNIVWGNRQTTAGQLFGTFSLTYCDVQGGASGEGNFNRQPLFADSSYFLSSLSPCIDAGDTLSSWTDPENSLRPGTARFPALGSLRSDMGAYGGPGAGVTFALSEAPVFVPMASGDLVATPSASRSVNWIDYDRDEVLDLFVTNGPSAGQNNMLYNGDGGPAFTFTTITGSPIVLDDAPSDGSSWADADNDGSLDAFVVNWYNQNNMFFKGDGAGGFTRVMSGAIVTDGGYSETCSWGDYDNDGFVDLYVTNSGLIGGGAWPNFLYRNNGDATFTKVTTGEPVTDIDYSRGCNWTDYDGDGDIDLFVANENGGNNSLYRNLLKETSSATFEKITTGSIVNDGGDSWSGSWGDYDNDGDADLYVANTNNQDDFLYRNNGNGTFNRVMIGIVVHDSGYSASSAWGDVDNDGDLDLVVTSAYGPSQLTNRLYRNTLMETGEANFEKIISGPLVTNPGWTYGVALGDYDRDGDLDVFVAKTYNENESNMLYSNESAGDNHWLTINCEGRTSNRAAIGARVRVRSMINEEVVWQLRDISGQSGYCGQTLEAHFGLGSAATVDSLIVDWPSGNRDVFTAVASQRMLHIVERDTAPVGLISPSDSSQGQPPSVQFVWTRSLTTATYRLQIATDSAFAGIIHDAGALTDTTHTGPVLPLAQSYWWRVAVERLGRIDGWSTARYLYIGAQPFTYEVRNRWNIVSLPILTTKNLTDSLLPTAVSLAYAYELSGNYAESETLVPGTGYWVKFSGDQQVVLQGFPVPKDTFALHAGWNLIGSITDTVATDEIVQIPPGLISSPFYKFSNGYSSTDSLVPFGGFWVRASAEGTIVLESEASPSNAYAARTPAILSNMLTLIDNSGATRQIAFNRSSQSIDEPAPPVPPQGIVDFRYASDQLRCSFPPNIRSTERLSISSAHYPVRLAWDIPAEEDGYAIEVNGTVTPIWGRGEILIPTPAMVLNLVSLGTSAVTTKTKLEQNYPNPCNPSTTIAYHVAGTGEVTIRIFDVLGREIRSLFCGHQESGRYSLQWDGTDNDGKAVASGMYYCMLMTHEADGRHMDVRKLALIE